MIRTNLEAGHRRITALHPTAWHSLYSCTNAGPRPPQADFPEESKFAVPESLAAKVAEGKLGRKSGEGYFKWDGDKLAA